MLATLLLVSAAAPSCTGSRVRVDDEKIGTTTPTAAMSVDASAHASSCGREENVHGRGYDGAARDCLWKAYVGGTPAELVITMRTVEGDPITFTLRVRAAKVVDVIEDNRDRFGTPGVRRSTCATLEKRERADGRYGFALRDCGDARPEITIP
jgi:hypothetical protein